MTGKPPQPPSDTKDFISLYLQYTRQTECPTFFHRWTAITSLGAFLGRNIYFRHGHFTLYPNLYTMLIGSPGTKKSSAIKIGAKVVKQAGYKTFAAKKTRQEKFLLDLAEQSERAGDIDTIVGEDILEQNLFGALLDSENEADRYEDLPPAECFIAADEFNNFIGTGNLEFVSILGELWDYEGVYDYKLKNSKSVFIPNPTISILGGNTPTGFSQAFPSEAIGQGFFSRLLLIYGEPSGVKYTFPPAPDVAIQNELITLLLEIQKAVTGELVMSSEAMNLLDQIYHKWEGIDDPRFEHYANRRLTHLLKLCLVVTASRLGTKIETEDVVHANTILTFTEHLMPKALGEFGKARNSDVAQKVMAAIDDAAKGNTPAPISFRELWKAIHSDLEKREQLVEIINNLVVADKIQQAGDGYLPKKLVRAEPVSGAVDYNILTDLERNMV